MSEQATSSQSMEGTSPAAGSEPGIVICVSSGLNRLWLAGLGSAAFVGEGASVMFRTLVHKGEEVEAKGKETTKGAREKVESAVSEIESHVRSVSDRVRSAIKSGEGLDILKRIGVPSREEVESLKQQLTQVIAKLDELSKAQHPAVPPKEPPKTEGSST